MKFAKEGADLTGGLGIPEPQKVNVAFTSYDRIAQGATACRDKWARGCARQQASKQVQSSVLVKVIPPRIELH